MRTIITALTKSPASNAQIPPTPTANTNRLTAVASTSLTYDGAGNIYTNGAQVFNYTGASELSIATTPTGSPGGSYLYDFLHRRVQKTTTSGITLYHYDDQSRLIEETQANGTLIRDYVWDDEVTIAQIDRNLTTGIETLTYLHTDHEGTPRLATDATPRIVWRFEGNAFGDTLPEEDPDQDGILTRIHLRYPGQYYDQETGLHYNWHRYYDPATGRYVSSDPIGLAGGLNTYAYVGSNPLRFVDPYGLRGNGNIWGDYQDQDGVCTFPANVLDRNRCTKQCCIEHDRCYKENLCSWSSWLGNTMPRPIWHACQICNARAVECVRRNARKSECECKQ